MKMETMNTLTELLFLCSLAAYLVGCDPSNREQKTGSKVVEEEEGSYGYDLGFLEKNNVNFHELADDETGARVVPRWLESFTWKDLSHEKLITGSQK